MKKTLKMLSALFLLTGTLNAQEVVKVDSYQLSGMTDYLTSQDIQSITEILSGKTGEISYEQLKDSEKKIQNYFDSVYGTKYKVVCTPKTEEEGVVYYEIKPTISKITYNQGSSVFNKVTLLSLKEGGTQENLDKRDLQMIEENPNRNLLLKYSLSNDGYLTANLIEKSDKELHHRFFVDNYGKSDKKSNQVRYGYQYLNSNIMDKDDVLGINVVKTREDVSYVGMAYHNPLEEVHGELDLNLGYGYVKKKFWNDYISMRGKNFEGDVRYSYNLPVFMDNYDVKNKVYIGGKYITSSRDMKFLSTTFSKTTKQFFIPYVGYFHNTRKADKYFDFDLKLEGNTTGIENHLSKNYAKLSAESNYLWQFSEKGRYYLKVEGALSSRVLDSELENDIISQNSIRATRKADNNVRPEDYILIKNEFEFGSKNTFYIYNDFAVAREYDSIDKKTKTEKIDTFGVGVRLKSNDHFRLDTNIGYDIKNTAVEKNKSKFVFGIKAETRF